jgi:DNA-binding protein H-NS
MSFRKPHEAFLISGAASNLDLSNRRNYRLEERMVNWREQTMSDNAQGSGEGGRRSAIDLDRLTVQELVALRGDIDRKIKDKQEQTRAELRAKWQEEATAAGLSLDAVLATSAASPSSAGRKARRDAGGTLPVKYRGPNGEEWSGRGRLPKWLQVAEAEGKGRDSFKV